MKAYYKPAPEPTPSPRTTYPQSPVAAPAFHQGGLTREPQGGLPPDELEPDFEPDWDESDEWDEPEMELGEASPAPPPSTPPPPSLQDAPAAPAVGAARILWVDAARAIAMFFIMWLHVRTSPEWLSPPVGGAICLFFVLAGYFMPRTARRCAERTLQLALAWLIWSWLTVILGAIFDDKFVFDWNRVFGINAASYNTPLWFLRNLIIFHVIFWGLMVLRILPLGSLVVLALCVIWPYDMDGEQHTHLLFSWIMAVSVGFALQSIKLARLHELMQKYFWCIVVLAISLLIITALKLPMMEHTLISYTLAEDWFTIDFSLSDIPWDSYGFALAYCAIALILSKLAPKVELCLALVGKNMMFVYAGHTLLYGFQIGLDQEVFGGMLGDGVWLPIVAMLLLTIASHYLCRWFPNLMVLLGSLSPSKGSWFRK